MSSRGEELPNAAEPQIRNPKLEIRNKHEIQNLKCKTWLARLGSFDIRALDLFRISSFDIRIFARRAQKSQGKTLIHPARFGSAATFVLLPLPQGGRGLG
jgi:hypothetical protein